jgi:photosystem II stability/assembly factor-like uncharacterized protein
MRLLAITLLLTCSHYRAYAEQFNARLFEGLRWRMIGPFRGGRTVAATGIPSQPNVFYVAANNGGVWKTTDFGRTWTPIFDDQPTGSIGALALAPSNPNIIYVGSGEGLQRPDLSTGDGIYKSTDAGKTWEHVGLRDGQQIGGIIVDPRDPNRVFVAVLGHPYGPNEERGVFRSTDGGKSWQKVLYKDDNTGAIALAFDPSNPDTIYADLWAARQGPWENGAWHGAGSGLYKSTDAGKTWRQLIKGLPTIEEDLGRIGFAIAPSDPNRLYATVDAPAKGKGGIYRSDDAGESWRRVNDQLRLWGRGDDFAEVKVDPKNKDIVYVANTSTYRSTDGGQKFTAIKGAPGGDDYHTIWINPDNRQIILLASDQGAVITVNGGETWSSWYNQPTAQFYHVSTDNQFPYWVYGGQQESGSAGVASRGNDGQITFREFHPVGAEEYGYVAVDPLNPNHIYGGKISRYDRTTGQVQNISPSAQPGQYRFLRTAPVIFSPVDPHILYFAGNVLFKTTTGGHSWDVISPDLSRKKPEVPECIGVYGKPEMATMPRRGVIYTVAPSYQDVNVIWAGTDDGLIHLTRDGGKTWKDITPPGVTSWSKISIIDAGRFDKATAYAAVNRIRVDDQRPHIYRTHDFGQTWTEITHGLPNDPINTVREDPVRKGLLFAGSERAVHVSFDDGENWQSLRLNMPATSIRDLVIHDDDVVVGTHGRSFWILDNITPLRQLTSEVARTDAFLFKPQLTYRVRWNVNTDTPLPPEEPAGKNPPDGAMIDYYLAANAPGVVTLEVFDQAKKLIRRYTSTDKPEPVKENELDVPTYWIRPPQILSGKAGMHRFVWDLHFPPPEGTPRSYPIAAIYGDTPSEPKGPWVLPGDYIVELAVNGHRFSQPMTVKMDPRVKTPPEGIEKQFEIASRSFEGSARAYGALQQVRKLRSELKATRERAGKKELIDEIDALERKASDLEGQTSPGRRAARRGRPAGEANLSRLHGELIAILALVDEADAVPTTQATQAAERSQQTLKELLARWDELRSHDLRTLNERLEREKLPPLRLE